MSAPLIPAEAFPPGEYLAECLGARCWTVEEMAQRMGGDVAVNVFSVEVILAQDNDWPAEDLVKIDDETSAAIGRALKVSPLLFARLDAYYRAWRAATLTTPTDA